MWCSKFWGWCFFLCRGMFHHQQHCQAFQAFSPNGSSCLLTSFFYPFSPLTAWAWVLEVGPLTPSIWVLFNPICIYGFLLFWDEKCRLLFIYFWIALLETRSTLSITIYYCFSFSGVLSSLRVTQPCTKRLGFDFDNFCWEIWKGLKWNIFFGTSVYCNFAFGPRSLDAHAPFGISFSLTPFITTWVEFNFNMPKNMLV